MPKWTSQQLDAINTRGRSVIVSAAAGSGKTAVLVERLVRIISETDPERKIPADRMVVVTFTNDAAAQMKQRLSSKLTERLAELAETGDAESCRWLMEQRARLSSAKIATINSFCFDLIRENADALGISPQFTVAEPAQESIYQRRALDKVMEHWTKEVPAMDDLYNHFCTKSDSDLEELVLCIANFLGSLAFPRLWIRDARTMAADGSILFKRIRDAFCEQLTALIELYRDILPVADSARPNPKPKTVTYRGKAETDIAALEAYRTFVQNAEPDDLCSDPTAAKPRFKTMPRKNEELDTESSESFRYIVDIIKKRVDTLTKTYLEPLRFFREDAALSATLVAALLDLTQEYLDALLDEKLRQNALSFADGEELTLRLLADIDDDGSIRRSRLAEQLSESCDLIMVDEYQDTNNKQDCIFKLLSRGCTIDEDGVHYGSNAFLVGDVKQSIYTFRQSNPENFRRVIAESTPLKDCRGEEMARVYLNQNFRSAQGVLDFVNALFSAVMRENCGDVNYDRNEQLNYGSPVYPDVTCKTQFLMAQQRGDLPEDSTLQAECIADTIARMIGHEPVWALNPEGKPVSRPAQAGDFCILLRSVAGQGAPFAEALRKRGIGVTADADAGILDLPEIRLIRNLLRIIDNPLTDTAMAAVLFSPVYGFSAEDLAELKAFSQKRRLFLQMKELADAEECPVQLTDLQPRVQLVLSDLHAMQESAGCLPLEEAIWEVYRQTDLLSLQSLYDDASMRRYHLERFAGHAAGYRKHAALSGDSCLAGWLRYLDRLSDSGKDLEVKGTSAAKGCVAIKTIHKSKGLQFPFVFAARLERDFFRSPNRPSLLTSEDGMLGLRIYDRVSCTKATTAAYRYLEAVSRDKQRSEELRLLYVALTRAEQQLFVVTEQPDEKHLAALGQLGELLREVPEAAERLAPLASAMQEWLWYALFTSCDAEHLRRLLDGKESSGELADYRLWQYTAAQTAAQPEVRVKTAKADTAALNVMRRQLQSTYETEQSAMVSKYSVTQLAHPETGVLELSRRPQFTLEGMTGGLANLKGAERGTAVHKIMQLIDFPLAAQDAEQALQGLLDAGAINAAEAESIRPEQLRAFFQSDLYRRIAASDTVERERKIFDLIGSLSVPGHPEITERYCGTDGVVIGTMDLIFREADGWVIVDYKTDYATAGAPLLREYTLQLLLYKAAAEHIFGEPVKEMFLYSFTLEQALKIDEPN